MRLKREACRKAKLNLASWTRASSPLRTTTMTAVTTACSVLGACIRATFFSCYLVAAKTGSSVGRGPQDVAVPRERYAAISFAPAYDAHHDAKRPSSGGSNLSTGPAGSHKTGLKDFLSVSELTLDRQRMLDFRIGSKADLLPLWEYSGPQPRARYPGAPPKNT